MDIETVSSPCPSCGRSLRPDVVRTALFRGESLIIVEDVPAEVCDHCVEQFYEDNFSERLRALLDGARASQMPAREILVPVYSLAQSQVPAVEPGVPRPDWMDPDD